jgi:hypothetical protein
VANLQCGMTGQIMSYTGTAHLTQYISEILSASRSTSVKYHAYCFYTFGPFNSRPKIKNCLFPLYLPTQQNAPTEHILFADFNSKYYYFHFAPKKSTFYPILLHLHTHFVNKIKQIFTYLPTRYPQGPVGKGETKKYLS